MLSNLPEFPVEALPYVITDSLNRYFDRFSMEVSCSAIYSFCGKLTIYLKTCATFKNKAFTLRQNGRICGPSNNYYQVEI